MFTVQLQVELKKGMGEPTQKKANNKNYVLDGREHMTSYIAGIHTQCHYQVI
jgi:hypothetical protein